MTYRLCHAESKAEAALKGYFGEKKRLRTPISRVSAIEERETVWSDVFPATPTPCTA